jgi:preprotein translocase subunit YajC
MSPLFDPALVVAMAQPPAGQPSVISTVLPQLVIVALIFIVVVLLPMRRRQKKVQQFQSALKVGDRIVTTFGMYGQITKLDDKTIHLQIADKVKVEVARAAVGGYQGEEPVVPQAGGSL